MPVGIQRINARKSQPNPHIVFIKPLKGPHEEAARDFLERIAAQCVPIMREHHLSVVTLEEYEPNASFVGRNFNAGEVIQLVLKARFTGRWLPFSYVQMVMMHELAHCRQMNHSRAFWGVRDAYATHMRRLWGQGYTGEGIWGRGARLGTAAVSAANALPASFEANMVRLCGGSGSGSDGEDVLLEHLCGGTYRSRGRAKKRSQAPTLTYREQQERRIRRKFGVNGMTLGADVEERARLEGVGTGAVAVAPASSSKRKRAEVKPRVAKSKRGRELRAAAALARFEQDKKEETEEKPKDEEEDDEDLKEIMASIKRETRPARRLPDREFDDSEDDDSEVEVSGPDAVDIDGTRMVDEQGHGLVRVCEDDSLQDDDDAKRELRELLQTSTLGGQQQQQQRKIVTRTPVIKKEAEQSAPKVKPEPARDSVKREAKYESEQLSLSDIPLVEQKPTVARSRAADANKTCSICSFSNPQLAVTCAMCANVLLPDADPRAWKCRSAACAGSSYTNAGDCGVCGVCGERKSG